MSQLIVIDPVTRIEGHAKITLLLDDQGEVSDARFHVTELRGFEKFCEGRFFREMPGITAHICGICPVSDMLSSAKAGDEILAVEIPEGAVRLRRLLHHGQIIQSHALSFCHLSSPDLLLGHDADPAGRNIFGRPVRRRGTGELSHSSPPGASAPPGQATKNLSQAPPRGCTRRRPKAASKT